MSRLIHQDCPLSPSACDIGMENNEKFTTPTLDTQVQKLQTIHGIPNTASIIRSTTNRGTFQDIARITSPYYAWANSSR